MRIVASCSVALLSAASLPTSAADQVKFEWDLRLRHEHVEDDAFLRDADTTTARLRAGLRFDLGNSWGALIEGEGIADAGEHHNNGANGAITRPTVLDPDGTELNQAWISWKRDHFGAVLGRQRINLDNQRWIGNVGWRQNEQTFDALNLEIMPSDAWSVRYAWLDRVHRVSGDKAIDRLARERDLSSHLLNVGYKRGNFSGPVTLTCTTIRMFPPPRPRPTACAGLAALCATH